MVAYAKSIIGSDRISYLVASGEKLPLRNEVFDVIVGVGIFHHLHISAGLKECRRSLKPNGALELMEPNTLNPFSFIGRRILRTSIHTRKERTYTQWFLKDAAEKAGFDLVSMKMISFVGYALAFLSAWLGNKKELGLRKLVLVLRKSTLLIVFIDKLFESLPLINSTCWIIAMNTSRSW
jgi:SAM-dependent methyltransferase